MRGQRSRKHRLRVGWLLTATALLGLVGVAGYFTYQFQRTRNTARLLREARESEQSGNFDRAIESYGLYLERNGQDVGATRAYASLLYGRLESSRKWLGLTLNALRRLNRLDLQDTQTMERLVRLYLDLQQFGLAEELARSWIKSTPTDPQAIVTYARATNANNKSEEALRTLVEANNRDPAEAAFYPPIIDLLDNVLQRQREAQDWVDRALNHAPNAYPVELAAFNYFDLHGQFEKARPHIERALELAPDAAEVLLAGAQFFTSQGEFSRAGRLLERAAKNQPNTLLYLAARRAFAVASRDDALLVTVAGELQEAASAEHPVLLAQAAELYLRGGATSLADVCIRKLEEENQRLLPKGTIEVLRGARDLLGDRPYAAVISLEQAVRHQPSDLWTLELLARAYLRTGAVDEAADLYRRLTLLAPSMTSPRLALARLELESGQGDRAREVLNSLSNVQGPQRRQVQWLSLLAAIGETDDAGKKDLMRDAETLASNPPLDLAEMEIAAGVFVEGGRPDKAIELWKQWGDHSATHRRIGLDLARRLVAKGETTTASQWAALLRHDQTQTVESALVQCDILLAKGDSADAKTLASEFSGSAEDRGLLWELLADKTPDGSLKLSAMAKAAELRPQDVAIRRKWVRLVADLPTAQRIIDQIRALEGDQGVQWKFEKASVLLRLDASAPAVATAADLLRQCVDARSGWIAARTLLGYAWERLGDLPKAVESYRAALALDPDLATRPVAFRLVDVLKRLGRFQEADAVIAPLARAMPDSPDVLQLLVEQAIRRSELSSAASLAEQVLRQQSSDASWGALTADLLLRAGNADRAELVARDALSTNPKSPGAVTSLVQSLLAQNKQDEALALARSYAKTEKNPSFLILLIRTLHQTGRVEEAQRALEGALAQEPDDVTLYAFAAEFWAAQGDRTRQLALARKAIQLRGEDPQESLWLASILASGDVAQREEAAFIVGRRLAAHGNDCDALLISAQLALTERPPDADRAAHSLKAALKANPRSLPARKMFAALLMQTAELEDAYETVAGGLLDWPEDRDLLLLAAQIRQFQGDYEGSIPALRTLLSTPGRPPQAAHLIALAARQTHRIPLGISILESLPQRFDDETAALAALYEAANDLDKSVVLLKSVATTSPGLGAGALLHLFAGRGEFGRLEDFAREHAAHHPNDTPTQLLAAELLASDAPDRESRQRGFDRLARLAAAHPTEAPDARFRAGLAYLKHGDLVNAETMLLSAIQLAPLSPKPVNALAWLYGEESSNPQRGLDVIQKYESSGGAFTAELLDTYGLLLYRVERLDEANNRLRECLRTAGHSTDRTSAMFHLGLVQKAKGANTDAASNFRGALRLHDRVGGLTPSQVEQCQTFLDSSAHER